MAAEYSKQPLSLAVIIPARNEAHNLGRLLPQLREHDFDEIIVADNGSSDATAAIVAQFPHMCCISSPPGRGPALNAGFAASSSDAVLFLHADTILPAGAGAEIRRTLANRDIAGGCFRLDFDGGASRLDRSLLTIFSAFTRFDTAFTTFGDQAYFMRRTACIAAGGFAAWPILEDVDMRAKLKRLGRFVKLPARVTTSARRFERYGILRQQLRNILILALYFAGIAPARLARLYRVF